MYIKCLFICPASQCEFVIMLFCCVDKRPIIQPHESSSSFFAYFVVCTTCVILSYIIYHNRQKVCLKILSNICTSIQRCIKYLASYLKYKYSSLKYEYKYKYLVLIVPVKYAIAVASLAFQNLMLDKRPNVNHSLRHL